VHLLLPILIDDMKKYHVQLWIATLALLGSLRNLSRDRVQVVLMVAQQRYQDEGNIVQFNETTTEYGFNASLYQGSRGGDDWDSIIASTLSSTRSQNAFDNTTEPRCNPFAALKDVSLKHHNALVQTAASAPSNLDVLFLGDSIIEQWNGTKYRGRGLRIENRQAFERTFSRAHGGNLEGLAFGSGGDLTQGLNWRVENGLLPESLNPKVIWILIGTNNLKSDCTTPEILASSILEVARRVHRRKPRSKIVIQGMLPRGDMMGSFDLKNAWKSIQETNRRLKSICLKFPQLSFFEIEASQFFRWYMLRKIMDSTKFRDGVHPNAKGYKLIASQVQGEVQRLLSL
jgi:lysophospholipase L1-like esterase